MASSRLRKLTWWLLGALGLVFLLLQFEQPDRSNPPVGSEIQAPPEIAEILERACYDCHSHETDWPWYASLSSTTGNDTGSRARRSSGSRL